MCLVCLTGNFQYFSPFQWSERKLIATESCTVAMSIALDHDYCSVMPSDKDSKTDKPSDDEGERAAEIEPAVDADATRPVKRKEVLCPREDPDVESLPIDETSSFDARSSSLSPAHSMDSGVDADIENFLADFASSWRDDEDFGLNEEDIKELEALLNIETNELPTAKGSNSNDGETRPVAKANAQFSKRQRISEKVEKAIAEKNRKNAIAAKENREKKKKYMEGLENDVTTLREENKTLKWRNEYMKTMARKLSDEVKYLRSVLANESTISLLLKSVTATPGISLSSSLVQSSGNVETEKESDNEEGDRQYVTRSRKRRSEEDVGAAPGKRTRSSAPGGVCLHVSHGKVSLELCAQCERKATQSGFL